MCYQTFLMFLILYSVLLALPILIANIQFHLVDLLFFILVLPTYALYREYLLHHIAWIRMDQKFFVEYLIEKRKVSGRKILKKYVEEENYEKTEKKLKKYFNTKEGYDKNRN